MVIYVEDIFTVEGNPGISSGICGDDIYFLNLLLLCFDRFLYYK